MKHQSGQTLVILLVFVAVVITVTSTSVILSLINSASGSRLEQAQSAYDIAESGIENALIRYLRNPTYAGETLTVAGGSATITVTGSNPVTFTSRSTVGNFSRSLQVVGSYTNGRFQITSWQEIYL